MDPIALARLESRLAARAPATVRVEGFRAASVLVPIVVEPGGSPAARLLFIERNADLRSHAGQIAFPGGGREPADVDPIATALRETEEELGIPASSVRVLGRLDDVPTPSSFVITPVVALLRGPLALRLAREEVADTFLADLHALRATHTEGEERFFLGIGFRMDQYDWQGKRIWGATARIVRQLYQLLDEE